MDYTDSSIARFIRTFERDSATEEVSEADQRFAEVFLVVAPEGSQCVRSVDFAAVVPKRKQLFASLGWQSTELIGLKEMWLDPRYVLTQTRWRFIFQSSANRSESLEVNSTFLIDAGNEPFQIILYMTHQNIVEVLKARDIAGSRM